MLFAEMSDIQPGTLSLEEETTCNSSLNMTEPEISMDVTDGATSPNQTTESAPTLTSDDE